MKRKGVIVFIKSINDDQIDLILDILTLHVPGGKIECDPTFSKGVFYQNEAVQMPEFRFDIDPQVEGVVEADARDLPLADESIECMILDPPFLATSGKSLSVDDESNRLNKRFGVYPNEKALHKCYEDMLAEAHRVLKDNGILIFKCQDKVSSGKQYMSHVFIMNKAVEVGFYPKDLFILLAKNRLVADWQKRNQKHARKFHCYFWVFQKNNKIIEYT